MLAVWGFGKLVVTYTELAAKGKSGFSLLSYGKLGRVRFSTKNEGDFADITGGEQKVGIQLTRNGYIF